MKSVSYGNKPAICIAVSSALMIYSTKKLLKRRSGHFVSFATAYLPGGAAPLKKSLIG